MTQEKNVPSKILFVDDEEVMRHLMTRVADRVGVEGLEVFENADSAVTRIGELHTTAAGVISDGLNGGWETVIAAAREARVPAVVLTGENIQAEVEAAGATFLAKPADLAALTSVLEGFQLRDESFTLDQ